MKCPLGGATFDSHISAAFIDHICSAVCDAVWCLGLYQMISVHQKQTVQIMMYYAIEKQQEILCCIITNDNVLAHTHGEHNH